MKKAPFVLIFLALLIFNGFGQTVQKSKPSDSPKASATANDAAALELAKATLAAHGGDKLKGVKTLIVRGAVDITSTAFNQAIPSAFSIVISGEKYRVELANQIQSFKQTYDGEQTATNVSGFMLPPITRLGFPLLARLNDTGFSVSNLPQGAKKRHGFRITAPDGYFTDFYTDEKTNLVTGYESLYEMFERKATTSVEVDKYRSVDGVTLPDKYAQRFDLGQMTIYGDFKSKEVLINSQVADEVFSISK